MRCIPIISTLFILFFLTSGIFAKEARKIEIFVHQGIVDEVPENTFAALRRAAELGVDGIKVDVRRTKDLQLVLMHDETIDRTTSGKGRVDQLLYAEIQQYDAGLWRGVEFENERVPLLPDVLLFCKINNLKLILDIKQAFLEKQVLDLIESHDMSSQVYLWGILRNIHVEDSVPSMKELVFVSPAELSEGRIARIHAERKYAFSTILNTDNREAIKKYLESGPDVILVDYPYVVFDILGVKCRIPANQNPSGGFTGKTGNNFQQENINNPDFIRREIKTLVRTLKSGDFEKARTTALALIVLPQKYVVPHLINLLTNRNPLVKQNAVWALGFCGDKDSADYIHPLLAERNLEVRREAVLTLGRLGNILSVPVLLETFNAETNTDVRYDIVRTLGTLGDRRAAFTLRTILMQEKSWHLKGAAVGALHRIRDDKAISDLAHILVTDAGEEATWTRSKAAWVLASMGEKAVPHLIRALSDNEEVTRIRATWALVKVGLPALPSLRIVLRDPDTRTRERAAQALGWIENENAVTALTWALNDKEPSVVSAAAWALGRIGDPRALVSLKSLRNHRDDDIRKHIHEAIARITKT
ncbi:MAG: HEAT repeat domain-containing protein [Candidatus Loosdrechtia sp.]|uniref:HEAT repeat domain-containing protein n=1 Tax=Candidatus Loosdrechtia sp. TaxID=3101272 RepID=UPI003A75B85F|nr:MAG: HEAT repeat domain-containing protein [Candidatus Jettenia sp. AMX2]